MHTPIMGSHVLIRVDRKRLERQLGYFWWHASLGSASGTLVFFFSLRVSLKHGAKNAH